MEDSQDMERKIDHASQSSMDLAELNNLIVSFRKTVKKGKLHTIRKICNQIKMYSKSHTDEKRQKLNQERANRLLNEVQIIKALSCDKITKFSLGNTSNLDTVPPGSVKLRALIKLCLSKPISEKVNSWRNSHFDWRSLAAFLLTKNTGRRYKKKKTIEQRKMSRSAAVKEKITEVFIRPPNIKIGDSLKEEEKLDRLDLSTVEPVDTVVNRVITETQSKTPLNKEINHIQNLHQSLFKNKSKDLNVTDSSSLDTEESAASDNEQLVTVKPSVSAVITGDIASNPTSDETCDNSTEDLITPDEKHTTLKSNKRKTVNDNSPHKKIKKSEKISSITKTESSENKHKKPEFTERNKNHEKSAVEEQNFSNKKHFSSNQMVIKKIKWNEIENLDDLPFESSVHTQLTLPQSKTNKHSSFFLGGESSSSDDDEEMREPPLKTSNLSYKKKNNSMNSNSESVLSQNESSKTNSNKSCNIKSKLHPSWEASRKRKELECKIVPFSGQKKVFDDD